MGKLQFFLPPNASPEAVDIMVCFFLSLRELVAPDCRFYSAERKAEHVVITFCGPDEQLVKFSETYLKVIGLPDDILGEAMSALSRK